MSDGTSVARVDSPGVRAASDRSPLVSVVIPVLNGEKFIARCLASIKNQQMRQGFYEVIIVDNGSTDRTHQLIGDAGFDFKHVETGRVSALRNHGARLARGRYLAFLDGDVELSPGWLETGLQGLQDSAVVAIGGPRRIPKDPTWVQEIWHLQRSGRRSKTEATPVPWLFTMALMVRRETFNAVAGFNERLETGEDVDLGYRLGLHGMILHHPAMEAIHWGEDPDLKTFWRKEVWRGMGTFEGIRSHGLRWDEVPSLGYPLYLLCLALLVLVGVGVDMLSRQVMFTPAFVGLLAFPSFVLALTTATRAKRFGAIPSLFLLYVVYGFARAYAAIKAAASQWSV